MRRSSDKTHFGSTLSHVLDEKGLTQGGLARATGKAAAYVSNTMTGVRRPSARWVDLVSDALELRPSERIVLHQAAARDHGFRLDLNADLELDLTSPKSAEDEDKSPR